MGVLDWVFGSMKTQPARGTQSAPPTPATLPPHQAKIDTKTVNQELARLYAQRDPRNSCHKPLNLLQHVFVFASGDPLKLVVLPGAMQATTGATMEEINKLVGRIHLIQNCVHVTEILQSKSPPVISETLFNLEPTMNELWSKENGQLRIRGGPDPSGQDFAVMFIYRKS